MSLFAGNLSHKASISDLKEVFETYGPCQIRIKGNYAFIDYEDPRDAEDAMVHSRHQPILGREINLEWSKLSDKYALNPAKPPSRPKPLPVEKLCYSCGNPGHYSRNCPSHIKNRSRSNSKSSSIEVKHHKHHHHHHHRHRSHSHDSDNSKSDVSNHEIPITEKTENKVLEEEIEKKKQINIMSGNELNKH